MQGVDAGLDILADLYWEYTIHMQDGPETLGRIGRSYLSIARQHGLKESQTAVIEELADIQSGASMRHIEETLLKADLDRKAILRREREQYESFCLECEPSTKLALEMFPLCMAGVPISYRMKDHCLHLELVSLDSMSLHLDFDDVLIEDGRNPGQVIMDRIRIERVTSVRRAINPGGAEVAEEVPAYRVSFVNRFADKYPSRFNSFTCTSIQGRLRLFDYASWPGEIRCDVPKLAWERIGNMIDAYQGKMHYLGIPGMNESEIAFIPFANVFGQMIRFYLDKDTLINDVQDGVSFSKTKALEILFEERDVLAVCQALRPLGINSLADALEEAVRDRIAFCDFWLRYAAGKRCTKLYSFLMDQLSQCADGYERHPLPLSYRKYHSRIRRHLDAQMGLLGWQGSFPCYYKAGRMAQAPAFLYSSQYPHKKGEGKPVFIDYLESVSKDAYMIKVLTGEILMREGEKPSDYCALDCCFQDGARRRASLAERILVDADEEEGQVLAQAADLAREVSRCAGRRL